VFIDANVTSLQRHAQTPDTIAGSCAAYTSMGSGHNSGFAPGRR